MSQTNMISISFLFALFVSSDGFNLLAVPPISPRSSTGSSSTITTSSISSSSLLASADDEELFDPLRSPHSYPNGIDADRGKHENKNKNESDASKKDDFFDPLRSPHSYPNGIDADAGPADVKNDNDNDDGDDWTPMKMKNVKGDFSGAVKGDYKVRTSKFTRDWAASPNPNDTSTAATTSSDELFDPLKSPHSYPKGTSHKPLPTTTTTTTETKHAKPRTKIGIILIDHGSRRPSSNEHLERVAELYRSKAPDNFVVRAAHMEIAPPSIKDVMRDFWNEHLDDLKGDGGGDGDGGGGGGGVLRKIICHPYFLSPGRHVTEDVPELIRDAVSELNGEQDDVNNGGKEERGEDNNDDNDRVFYLGKGEHKVQVIMTEPVGSNLDSMVDIVGDMVEGSLEEEDIV